MYPNLFDYYRPESLDEAVALLAQHGEDARPLAGGQSLIPLMKLRVANPTVLVDLNRLRGLAYVERRHGTLALGALARHADVEAAAPVQAALPIMLDAARVVGDAQVRNLGTVAGALAEADPGGDWGPVLLALNGEVQCRGPRGERTIAAGDLFTDYFTTALAPDELITEVRVPAAAGGAGGLANGGAYLKLERRAGDFAVVGVAVQVALGADGTCQEVGIGVSGAGATPIKPAAAEAALHGQPLDAATIDEAARLIDAAIDPWTDRRAPAEYRRAMVGVYFRRALALARERAQATGAPSS
ncbi:MAG TPA: xanthine dehydrogenase family protein subunit M [Chloroflexota bacterium]|jgi:carbon-monoxide dehydrogenase medium subunit